jgi:hypothetical protein
MGEVLFSEEVAKLLDDVRRVLNDNFDDDAYIAAVSRKKVCADTLVAMRPLAKRDLKS